MITEISPTNFEVALDDNGTVKLEFSDDQARTAVMYLNVAGLPLLVSELEKCAPRPRSQMRPEDVGLGKNLTLVGTRLGPAKDGGVVLTLSIEIEEGAGVDLPIHLSMAERHGLVTDLMAFDPKA